MNILNDSYAMLLLCSDIALGNSDNNTKPYTVSQWSKLAERLLKRYLYVGFMRHQCIEKVLKAVKLC